eukprot:1178032-Prorocentrum_minimum.AAC.3
MGGALTWCRGESWAAWGGNSLGVGVRAGQHGEPFGGVELLLHHLRVQAPVEPHQHLPGGIGAGVSQRRGGECTPP